MTTTVSDRILQILYHYTTLHYITTKELESSRAAMLAVISILKDSSRCRNERKKCILGWSGQWMVMIVYFGRCMLMQLAVMDFIELRKKGEYGFLLSLKTNRVDYE